MMMNKSRGRPRSGTSGDRRAGILQCATALFSENGYRDTTLRRIASDADCDMALISYYFGSKAGLFAEVMRLTIAPAEVLAVAIDGDRATFGHRLANGLVSAWEDPQAGPKLRHLGRSALGHPDLRHSLSQYLDREILAPLEEFLGGRHAHERAVTILSLVAGHVFTHYILEVPAAATLPGDRARATLASMITAVARPA